MAAAADVAQARARTSLSPTAGHGPYLVPWTGWIMRIPSAMANGPLITKAFESSAIRGCSNKQTRATQHRTPEYISPFYALCRQDTLIVSLPTSGSSFCSLLLYRRQFYRLFIGLTFARILYLFAHSLCTAVDHKSMQCKDFLDRSDWQDWVTREKTTRHSLTFSHFS